MSKQSVEITCSECGADTLIVRKPKYEGLSQVGEQFICSACGYEYPDEAAVPYQQRREIAIFTEEDRSKAIDVFQEDEKGRLCRYCRHYVVNPFVQWCAWHKNGVEATDICPQFEKIEEEQEPDETDLADRLTSVLGGEDNKEDSGDTEQ